MLTTILTTFVTVFLAELGDKTQLATLSFASSSDSKWAVFIGSAVALVATSAIAVLTAGVIARYANPTYIKLGSGALFVVLGLILLIGVYREA